MTPALNSDVTGVLRRLLRYVKPYQFVIVPAVLATVVYALITGVVPLFVKEASDLFSESLRNPDEIDGWLDALKVPVLLAVVFILRGIMDFLTVYGLNWVGRSAIRDLRTDLFRQYLYLPVTFHDRNATGDLISRLTFNTEQIAEAITSSFVILIRDTLLVFVMIVIMIYFNYQLTLILAVVGPVIALLLRAMSRAFRRYSTRIQNSMGDVTRVAGQALQGQRVVKVFAGQEYETRRFEGINRHNFRLNLRLVATRAFGDVATQIVVIVGVSVILFFVFSGLLTEDVDSGEFLGFITAVGVLLTSLKRLTNSNAVLQRGIAAATSLFEILDEPAEETTESADYTAVVGALSFADVSFRYGDQQEEVLRQISFDLEPGKTLAIVGRSGSGKSTLVSLLPRFYDVTSGAIYLDGKDIRDYPLQALRQHFSVVSQEVVMFDDTIAGNIAYGALSSASRDEIERAAETAYVRNFTDELPLGLDTAVGESGALLSGGQRQRIAIARAVLKDAPVLILDEATSALDSESEREVQSALTELMRGRTTLVIAHRLSTVERADRIIVMHEGRIVESGTHVQLLAAGGYYASLYRLQFAE